MMTDILSFFSNNSLTIIVKPNSPKTKVIGYDENRKALKIALHAEPEQGKANIELIKFLKKQLKKEVKIISGFTSKKKLVKITN